MGTSGRKYTLEEYLALEAASDTRHEVIDGEIFPVGEPSRQDPSDIVPGRSRDHNHATSGFVVELRTDVLAKGCGCVAYGFYMRVQVDETTNFYPDAFVLCPPIEGPDAMSVTNPVVVVEVQSPSTGSWDLSGRSARSSPRHPGHRRGAALEGPLEDFRL